MENCVKRDDWRNRVWKRIPNILVTIMLCLFALMMITPFIWMLSASFKPENEVMAVPLKWIPETFTWNNYKKVLNINTPVGATNYQLLRAYGNSIVVSVCSTVLSVSSSALAGYAFAKLRFKGSNVLFILYLAQMMVPTQLTLIPRFTLFKELELVNNHMSLILPKVVSVSSTFLIRQAFRGLPHDLREAAKLDGASEFKIFGSVMLPLIKPTLGAIATVEFLESWNAFLDPLIFLPDWSKRTLPIALNQFMSDEVIQYNLIMAACCLAVIPVFIVFLCGQKYFLKGITVGAVKG